MKPGKDDRVVITTVTILAGVVLAAIGFTSFLQAARHDIRVAQFVLGVTIIFGGVGHLMLRSQWKSIGATLQIAKELAEKNNPK